MVLSRVPHDPLSSDNFRKWVEELIQAAQNMGTGLSAPNPAVVSYQSHSTASPAIFDVPPRVAYNPALPVDSGKPSTHAIANDTQPTFHHQTQCNEHQDSAGVAPPLPATTSEGPSTSSLPTVFKLYGWCPTDIKADGDCRIAGFYKNHPGEPFSFVKSSFVSSVSEDGRTVYTDDDRKYLLHEGISWWICSTDLPGSHLVELPPHLIGAFSHGFPGKSWRQWTQGLYYFLSTRANSRSSVGEIVSCHDKAQQFSGNSASVTKQQTKVYDHILSYQPLVDLDLLSRRDDGSPQLTDAPVDESFENPASPTPSSTITPLPQKRVKRDPLSNTRIENKRHLPHAKCKPSTTHANRRTSLRAASSDFSSDSEGHDSVTSFSDLEAVAAPQIFDKSPKIPKMSADAMMKIKERKRNEGKKRPSEVSPPRKSSKPVGRLPGRRNRERNISEKFSIHTASGHIVDARDLEQTRSGRWVIPRLDRRYEQSFYVSKNGVSKILPDSSGRH